MYLRFIVIFRQMNYELRVLIGVYVSHMDVIEIYG